MHEMSLAEGVREIVESTAQAHGGRRVRTVVLHIGALAPVEEEALRFCFEAVMRGGLAEGARLEVERIPGTAWCWDCSSACRLDAPLGSCPTCGGRRLEVTGGKEMRVHELELAEETASCA